MWKKKLGPVVIVLIFSVGIGCVAWFTLARVIRQLPTYRFAQTEGRIDSIKVNSEDGDDATLYGVDVQYHFTVKGQRIDGTRVRYGAGKSSDNWAASFVKAHPVGSRVDVYYDPANPHEALLVRGIDGSDLFMLMFAAPFVCAGVGLWIALAISWRKKGLTGFKVKEMGDIVRMRPPLSRAIFMPVGVLGLASFAAGFVVAFGFGGFHPSLGVMKVAWCVIGVLTILSVPLTAWWILSGRSDIVLHGIRRVVIVRGREIPYARILRVRMERAEQRDSEGTAQVTHAVWLDEQGGSKGLRVKRWWGEEEDAARKMSVFLSLHMGVPTVDAQGRELTAGAAVEGGDSAGFSAGNQPSPR